MATEGVKVFRIISGGQTGADQGGLYAARELGVPTGGTAPQHWWTEAVAEEAILRGFGLVECAEPGYDARTKRNVVDADATVIFGAYSTGGSALTAKIAEEERMPLFHVAFPQTESEEGLEAVSVRFREWLDRFQIGVLNVAGNRESVNPGIQEFTRRFLVSTLRGKV